MQQRLSVLSLGVQDLAVSRAFYESLGWEASPASQEDIAFFQSGCLVIGLWSREALATDSCVSDPGGWGGITLAHNVGSVAEVDAVLAEAERVGATIGRRGAETFWGGYSGVFLDPDGHPWEVAHNPYWPMDVSGAVHLPNREGGSQ